MASETIKLTVEDIFNDFKARRTALVRALTQEFDEFYKQCDPAADNLCLFGHSNGAWQVTLPTPDVPPEIPEPVIGINFARDGMQRNHWLYFVAVHSDSWLLSVAFFPGALLDPSERERLFKLINGLPTIFEVVTAGEATKGKSIMIDSGSEPEDTDARVLAALKASNEPVKINPNSAILCGECGGVYFVEEFWIKCHICERWFHGVCVKISPAQAESIKEFKCPSCTFVLEGEHVR